MERASLTHQTMGGREVVITVLAFKPVWYISVGVSGPNCAFVLRIQAGHAPRIFLCTLDFDPPPFLPVHPSRAGSPVAIIDAVPNSSTSWPHRARCSDTSTPHARVRRGVVVVSARPQEHGECLRKGSILPERPARGRWGRASVTSFSAFPFIHRLCSLPSLHALLRASSLPSITGAAGPWWRQVHRHRHQFPVHASLRKLGDHDGLRAPEAVLIRAVRLSGKYAGTGDILPKWAARDSRLPAFPPRGTGHEPVTVAYATSASDGRGVARDTPQNIPGVVRRALVHTRHHRLSHAVQRSKNVRWIHMWLFTGVGRDSVAIGEEKMVEERLGSPLNIMDRFAWDTDIEGFK
ncbi:hypothetical protein DFH09DRAFT_1077421 [Mycena vulgaris]|nr:hypothetical protein DFH09DRAFT_1077421 [Mycena vulgaris]